ncbi:hypothetical protein FB451DRAFT_579808 [Mycena latifolia]|nr:hypothetical protein FB451DRAFT_579808 [Mycena latifolia]
MDSVKCLLVVVAVPYWLFRGWSSNLKNEGTYETQSAQESPSCKRESARNCEEPLTRALTCRYHVLAQRKQ